MTISVCERVAAYSLSVLPEENVDAHVFTIRVEYCGGDRWAIRWLGECLHIRSRRWDHEPLPSSRTPHWLAGHRTDLKTALRVARELAPGLMANGRSAQEIAAECAR